MWAELTYGSAHWVARLAVQIPEHHRTRLLRKTVDPDLRDAFLDRLAGSTRHCEAGYIALYISHENRNAETRETFCKHKQRNSFAGTGGAGDRTMAVTVPGDQVHRLLAFPNKDLIHESPQLEIYNCTSAHRPRPQLLRILMQWT